MGKIVYECSGCGTVTHDPIKNMELLRAAGRVACCPERKMLPAYLTSTDRAPDNDTLNEAYNLGVSDAADRTAVMLGALALPEDLDPSEIDEDLRRLRKPVALPTITLEEIGALFFRLGGSADGDRLTISPIQLNQFGSQLVVRAETRVIAGLMRNRMGLPK